MVSTHLLHDFEGLVTVPYPDTHLRDNNIQVGTERAAFMVQILV